MNRCVCCGDFIPEGRQYCKNCGMDEKFGLGRIVMTKGIAELIKNGEFEYDEIAGCLLKHRSGDWGDLCEDDKRMNDWGVELGGRILSCYHIGKNKDKIWIITEWDRSVTTILLPEEY